METLLVLLQNPTVWLFLAFYLINLVIGCKSQLDAWALAHPRVAGLLKLIRGVLPCDPWLILSGLSLVIKGSLPAKLMPIAEVIAPTKETTEETKTES